MPHIEPQELAAKLHDPTLFTVGELTSIASIFNVTGRDLIAALGQVNP